MRGRLYLKKISENNRGGFLVLAVCMMLIFFTIGSALLFMMRSEGRKTNNHLAELKAFYVADAGFEYAVAELLNDNDWNPDADANPKLFTMGNITYFYKITVEEDLVESTKKKISSSCTPVGTTIYQAVETKVDFDP
ncbi:MAG: hypothetical protein V1872_08490 [bacterium]